MATIRQPVGAVVGKALNMHRLPLPKRAKDFLFRQLEQGLNAFSFQLQAPSDILPCQGEGNDGGVSYDEGSSQTVSLGTGDAVATSSAKPCGCGGGEVKQPSAASLEDYKKSEVAEKALEPIRELVRKEGFEPLLIPIGNERGERALCCKLREDGIAVAPAEQEFKATLTFNIEIEGVRIGTLELTADLKFGYAKLGAPDAISGKCPLLCSPEVRDITVVVTLSGRVSAKLNLLDFDDLFGRNVQRADLSMLPNVNRQSVSIGEVRPSQGGATIEFGLSLSNFNESYVYRWQCQTSGGSTLVLQRGPYPYTPPAGSSSGTSGGDSGSSGGSDFGLTPPAASKRCSLATINTPVWVHRRRVVTNPNGTVSVFAYFKMEPNFRTAPDGDCSCCEYRQYVRGEVQFNGATVPILLPNPSGGRPLPLLPRPADGSGGNYREDGQNAPPGQNNHYGHRSAPYNPSGDEYLPTRGKGCQYRGRDYPGQWNMKTTDRLVYDIDFLGRIIDTCDNSSVVDSSRWRVLLRYPNP